MKAISILLFTLLSTAVHAGEPKDFRMFPVLRCPNVGEEYEKMLASLEEIKSAIKGDACQEARNDVTDLGKLLNEDREKVVAIVQKAGQGELPKADADFVRKYAEDVTKKVSGLHQLFLSDSGCFDKDRSSKQMASLASLVGEATKMVSTVAGPYGVPIALAGNIVAGFMTGLNDVLQSRSGYDFNDDKEWASYIHNLCAFYDLRGQMDHLLDPQSRLNRLAALKRKVNSQLREINSKAPASPLAAKASGLKEWLEHETVRVQEEANTHWGRSSGQHILSRAKLKIENFLIGEAPSFLSFQAAQSQRDYYAFLSFVVNEGRPVLARLAGVAPNLYQPLDRFQPLPIFEALVVRPIPWEQFPDTELVENLRFSWISFRDRGLEYLRVAEGTLEVADDFCSFFKHAGYFGGKIESACLDNPDLPRLRAIQADLEGKLAPPERTEAFEKSFGQDEFDLSLDAQAEPKEFAVDVLDAIDKALDEQEVQVKRLN